MVALWSVAPHTKKKLRPQDIIQFSWETGLEVLEKAKKDWEASKGIFPESLDNG